MADKSAIEWTDATWNPVTGCTRVGPGCKHCYAERFAERFRGTPGHAYERGFDLTLRPERLDQPLRWQRPRRIFVNSMSDLFHKGIPSDYVDRVFDVMEQAPRHVFQVLTKRSIRQQRYVAGRYADRPPPRHVWFGVSVEDAPRLGRVAHLRRTPAVVRFVSAEPLLGPLDAIDLTGVDWLIAGGESGPGARPMHPDWVRALRERCRAAGTRFFFKQWGGKTSKANGRTLDGRTHDAMPPVPVTRTARP